MYQNKNRAAPEPAAARRPVPAASSWATLAEGLLYGCELLDVKLSFFNIKADKRAGIKLKADKYATYEVADSRIGVDCIHDRRAARLREPLKRSEQGPQWGPEVQI
jgi:hypothetical protein